MNSLQRLRVQGIVLMVVGAVLLALNLSGYRFHEFWPLIFIGLGIYFIVLFLTDRSNYGVLMPASIMTVIGIMFQYASLEGWWTMRTIWPFFLIGPGLGFFLMYWFGKKESGLLIPGYILTGLGIVFLLIASEGWYLWPALLIIAGILMLLRHRKESTPPPPAGS